jgi:hypothetical protein
MVFIFTNRASSVTASHVAIVAGLLCWATSVTAENVAAPAVDRLAPIVVTAKRRPDPVPDAVLTQKVAMVLHEDAYFYDAHVTVTVRNGVVLLEGIVFDDWDLRQAMRISKKVAGVKRVVNDLEIKLGGE